MQPWNPYSCLASLKAIRSPRFELAGGIGLGISLDTWGVGSGISPMGHPVGTIGNSVSIGLGASYSYTEGDSTATVGEVDGAWEEGLAFTLGFIYNRSVFFCTGNDRPRLLVLPLDWESGLYFPLGIRSYSDLWIVCGFSIYTGGVTLSPWLPESNSSYSKTS